MTKSLTAGVLLASAAVTATTGHTPARARLSPDWASNAPFAGSSPNWSSRTNSDLAAMAQAIKTTDINAVYPRPKAWLGRLNKALLRSQAEAGKVKDAAGYRAVLEYFAAQFRDAHVFVTFTNPPRTFDWPGFLARQQDGHYYVAASVEVSTPNGGEITECNGRPIARWIETISDLEIAPPATLESTRGQAAARLFLDRGSPLRARPSSCTIDGRSTLLHWRSINAAVIKPEYDRLRGKRDAVVDTALLDQDGAWVTLGYFQPQNAKQADTFRKAIANAPTLRKSPSSSWTFAATVVVPTTGSWPTFGASMEPTTPIITRRPGFESGGSTGKAPT